MSHAPKEKVSLKPKPSRLSGPSLVEPEGSPGQRESEVVEVASSRGARRGRGGNASAPNTSGSPPKRGKGGSSKKLVDATASENPKAASAPAEAGPAKSAQDRARGQEVIWAAWIQRWFRKSHGAGASALLHAVAILLLAILYVPRIEQLTPSFLVMEPTEETVEPVVEPAPEFEVDVEVEEMETVETPTLVAEEADVSKLSDELSAMNFELSETSDSHLMSFDALLAPSSKQGAGMGAAGGLGKEVKFFGQPSTARRYVFVIDNSNSMNHGKFETALFELEKAVEQMTPQQSFYVIFYSDTAYSLFHPEPVHTFVPATPAAKERFHEWLKTAEMCLHTNALEAVQKAVALNPDVIFLLGDGAFTDNTGDFLLGLSSGPQINVLGMDVKGKDAQDFEAISVKFKGTYKDVGVHPKMAQLAKTSPRPRNRSRGPVWGLKLK